MSDTPPTSVAPLVERFFRHEAGRLVSVLTRFFGWRHFELVEDMVQATLIEALQAWRVRLPENPSAWVYQIARRKTIDALRRDQTGRRIAAELGRGPDHAADDLADLFLDSEIADSQLRMIFACCHPDLARENQLALTLKALCGFSHSEIARALLLGEETVKKRLQRATRGLAERGLALEPPPVEELLPRLDAVHQVLYLLFNEGYASSSGTSAIRADLCEEAARLCYLLCSHPRFCEPATHALLALMLFHAARFESRTDAAGAVLLLEEQDRSRWDHGLIRRAQAHLVQAAQGTVVSRYHLEAGIASYHCLAPSYAETDWSAILGLYDLLLRAHPSPVYVLNRAVVVSQLQGPLAAIRELESEIPASVRDHYFLFDAVLGEFYRRVGDLTRARELLEAARAKTDSPFDLQIIDRRLATCLRDAVPPAITTVASRRGTHSAN
ncbi:MAG: sigma-70 family RNA polymerase sigma factor [Planctomycetes bacterium]|nr:sigma-70 family RNA polymerase sigma factor [Planctomycetota bacterium]